VKLLLFSCQKSLRFFSAHILKLCVFSQKCAWKTQNADQKLSLPSCNNGKRLLWDHPFINDCYNSAENGWSVQLHKIQNNLSLSSLIVHITSTIQIHCTPSCIWNRQLSQKGISFQVLVTIRALFPPFGVTWILTQ